MTKATLQLQKLELQGDKLRAEKGRLLGELAGLAEQEHAARVEAVSATPDKRSDSALGGPVQTLRKRRKKIDASLGSIEDELKAVDEAASAARVGIQREQLSAKLASARTWSREELDAYRAMAAAFKAFLDGYDRLADVLEAREAFRAELQASGLLQAGTPEQQAVFRDLVTHAVQPVCMDARAELNRLYRTCLDPSNEGVREVGNQSAARTDQNWVLVSGKDPIYPDLRRRLRRASVSRAHTDVTETLSEPEKARVAQIGAQELAASENAQAVGALLAAEAGVE